MSLHSLCGPTLQAGMQNIGFGPIGFGAHGPDEFVYVDSLVKTARVYIALVSQLSGCNRVSINPMTGFI